jgi:hypothetical protein
MNKKLIALVASLFVATSTQATVYERNFYGTYPTFFESVEQTKALAIALEKPAFHAAYKQEKQFQQNVQLAFLASTGVVAATFLGCVFAEWLQEFKVRKAEKAALIARLHLKAREELTTRYVS